jgi:hypothetical protein
MSDEISTVSPVLRNKTVLITAGAAIAIAVGVAAYFLLAAGNSHTAAKTAGLDASTAADNAPAGLCVATLNRARDYGVVPFNATLADPARGGTTAGGRHICNAQANGQRYSMIVRLDCADLSKPKCLQLFTVKNGEGAYLYDRRI